MGGIFLLKLNIGKRPIANKYREGKMKRTLKRELKVREIAKRETFEISRCPSEISCSCRHRFEWCTFRRGRSTSVLRAVESLAEGDRPLGVGVIAVG